MGGLTAFEVPGAARGRFAVACLMASEAAAAVARPRPGRLAAGSSVELSLLRLRPTGAEDLGVLGVEVREAPREGRPRFLAVEGAGTSSAVGMSSSSSSSSSLSCSPAPFPCSNSSSSAAAVSVAAPWRASKSIGPESRGSSSSVASSKRSVPMWGKGTSPPLARPSLASSSC